MQFSDERRTVQPIDDVVADLRHVADKIAQTMAVGRTYRLLHVFVPSTVFRNVLLAHIHTDISLGLQDVAEQENTDCRSMLAIGMFCRIVRL